MTKLILSDGRGFGRDKTPLINTCPFPYSCINKTSQVKLRMVPGMLQWTMSWAGVIGVKAPEWRGSMGEGLQT